MFRHIIFISLCITIITTRIYGANYGDNNQLSILMDIKEQNKPLLNLRKFQPEIETETEIEKQKCECHTEIPGHHGSPSGLQSTPFNKQPFYLGNKFPGHHGSPSGLQSTPFNKQPFYLDNKFPGQHGSPSGSQMRPFNDQPFYLDNKYPGQHGSPSGSQMRPLNNQQFNLGDKFPGQHGSPSGSQMRPLNDQQFYLGDKFPDQHGSPSGLQMRPLNDQQFYLGDIFPGQHGSPSGSQMRPLNDQQFNLGDIFPDQHGSPSGSQMRPLNDQQFYLGNKLPGHHGSPSGLQSTPFNNQPFYSDNKFPVTGGSEAPSYLQQFLPETNDNNQFYTDNIIPSVLKPSFDGIKTYDDEITYAGPEKFRKSIELPQHRNVNRLPYKPNGILPNTFTPNTDESPMISNSYARPSGPRQNDMLQRFQPETFNEQQFGSPADTDILEAPIQDLSRSFANLVRNYALKFCKDAKLRNHFNRQQPERKNSNDNEPSFARDLRTPFEKYMYPENAYIPYDIRQPTDSEYNGNPSTNFETWPKEHMHTTCPCTETDNRKKIEIVPQTQTPTAKLEPETTTILPEPEEDETVKGQYVAGLIYLKQHPNATEEELISNVLNKKPSELTKKDKELLEKLKKFINNEELLDEEMKKMNITLRKNTDEEDDDKSKAHAQYIAGLKYIKDHPNASRDELISKVLNKKPSELTKKDKELLKKLQKFLNNEELLDEEMEKLGIAQKKNTDEEDEILKAKYIAGLEYLRDHPHASKKDVISEIFKKKPSELSKKEKELLEKFKKFATDKNLLDAEMKKMGIPERKNSDEENDLLRVKYLAGIAYLIQNPHATREELIAKVMNKKPSELTKEENELIDRLKNFGTDKKLLDKEIEKILPLFAAGTPELDQFFDKYKAGVMYLKTHPNATKQDILENVFQKKEEELTPQEVQTLALLENLSKNRHLVDLEYETVMKDDGNDKNLYKYITAIAYLKLHDSNTANDLMGNILRKKIKDIAEEERNLKNKLKYLSDEYKTLNHQYNQTMQSEQKDKNKVVVAVMKVPVKKGDEKASHEKMKIALKSVKHKFSSKHTISDHSFKVLENNKDFYSLTPKEIEIITGKVTKEINNLNQLKLLNKFNPKTDVKTFYKIIDELPKGYLDSEMEIFGLNPYQDQSTNPAEIVIDRTQSISVLVSKFKKLMTNLEEGKIQVKNEKVLDYLIQILNILRDRVQQKRSDSDEAEMNVYTSE